MNGWERCRFMSERNVYWTLHTSRSQIVELDHLSHNILFAGQNGQPPDFVRSDLIN